VTLVPLSIISTMFRVCMSLVNLHVSSHHQFTMMYKIRMINIINIAQIILKS
jgi:hypothetical protein